MVHFRHLNNDVGDVIIIVNHPRKMPQLEQRQEIMELRAEIRLLREEVKIMSIDNRRTKQELQKKNNRKIR